jgi:hypothetical protein
MTGGAAGAALLVAAWSRVHTVAELYLVFAGLGLTMATLLYEPVLTVVTKWFSARRQAGLHDGHRGRGDREPDLLPSDRPAAGRPRLA